MTFTAGRGNDIVRPISLSWLMQKIPILVTQVRMPIYKVADRFSGKTTDDLFANMGKSWDYLLSDPQLRW